MSADIEKLWPLYYGHQQNGENADHDDDDDIYNPDDPRVAATQTFVDMFMEVRKKSTVRLRPNTTANPNPNPNLTLTP